MSETASADRENVAGVPIVGPAAAPGGGTVTLTRPLSIDGEFCAGEWETVMGTIDTTGATA